MVTITDVAQRAGVSIKTVSRVMNNAANVRPATASRVRDAMAALSYQPSTAARELRSGRSRSIGLLFSDPSGGFQARLHHSALKAFGEAGFFLAAGLFDETGMNWRAQLEDFLSRTRANAMVLVPPLCDSQELLEELAQREIPTVLISPSHTSPPAHSVGMDDYAAAREITRHLIGLGHRRIGHLSGPDDHVASSRRRQGFIDAMTEDQRAELRQDWILPGLFRFKDALGAAEAMLSSPDRPTAIFAANDDTAAAVCFTAGRMGLQVPEDLSVAGFDDAPIATTVWPPLTTIAQPFDAMAEKIVALLTHEHEPKPDREAAHILGHELKLRGSTAQPPGF